MALLILSPRRCCAAFALLATAACGLGPFDDEPGGRDDLPTRAAGPYKKLEIDFDTPAEEPYVVIETRAHVRDPSPLPRDDGGVRLWFTYLPIDDQGQSAAAEIWTAELPAITELLDVSPSRALAADDDTWEEDFVGEPSVIDLGDDHLVMYYTGGRTAPAIGRADSFDGGASWDKHPDNPLLDDARSPGAAALPDRVLLFFTSTDPSLPGIRVADSVDGVDLAPRDEPVVIARPALDEAFDPDSVGDPFALVTAPVDDVDGPHIGLFFTGTRPASEEGESLVSIGYAASYGGESFQRFLGPDPVLDGDAPSEQGPSALLVPAGGILFFHEAPQNRDRIAVAVHP